MRNRNGKRNGWFSAAKAGELHGEQTPPYVQFNWYDQLGRRCLQIIGPMPTYDAAAHMAEMLNLTLQMRKV